MPRRAAELDDDVHRPFPDLEVIGGGEKEKGVERLRLPAETRLTGRAGLFAGAEVVRFGPGAAVLVWLERVGERPGHVVIEGPCPAKTWTALRRKGYRSHAILERDAWPVGGPSPSAVEYDSESAPRAVTEEEDLLLRRWV